MDPFILCLCPTYKRPACLANAAACFLRQDHPAARRRLLICDDAGQFDAHAATPEEPWTLFTPPARLPNLSAKLNGMVAHALEVLQLRPELIAVWEDDDVYLPWHLSAIARAFRDGAEYIAPQEIWSTSKQLPNGARIETAKRRFHASWAFSTKLFVRVGGYPDTDRLDFDQQMRARLIQGCAPDVPGAFRELAHAKPSYVYRWPGMPYHGSQVREANFPAFWKSLEQRPAPWVGKLVPAFDAETRMLFRELAGIEVPA